MYRQGIGVPQNHTIAYTWYVLAEAAGEKRSVASKSELASQMSPEQVSIASANAVRWLKRHQL
jgi:TPR repeat protein